MSTAGRRFERSRDDRIVAGVAGGLARSTGATVGIVRLAFLLLTLLSGVGAFAYLAFWVAMPMEPGTLCERLLPCDARCDDMLWRLMVPA